MKKIFIGLFIALVPSMAHAQENIVQIVPSVIANDNEQWPTLDVQLVNNDEITDFSFNIAVPNGMTVYTDECVLNAERCPNKKTTGPSATTKYRHEVGMAYHEKEGYTTVLFSAGTSNTDLSDVVMGNSGTVFSLYVQFADGFANGTYPIILSNIRLTNPDSENIVCPDIATYVHVGAASDAAAIDFSSLTGFMPSDVVDATNTWLAGKTNVTSIDLSGLDNAAKAISPANKNALVYAKPESVFATVQAGNNVVVGEVCNSLVLADACPFAASKAFTAINASYSRTVPAAGWYSLCLPFAAETPDGVTVERYVSKDAGSNTVTFSNGTIEADKPCIFKTTAKDVAFSGRNVAVAVTGNEPADGDFTGTYSKIEGTLEGCYGLHPDGTGFGTGTATAYINPFRAFINISESSAKTLKIIHRDDSGTTGIATADAEAGKGSKIYHNLAGQRVTQPKKGLYIVDGKKVLIR